jgi:Cu2+-containing amine oxidase
VRTQLTGTTLNRSTLEQPEASAPKVGKDKKGVFVSAPYHQHFLNCRLDLDVDGPINHAMEMEVVPIHSKGFGHAFDTSSTHLMKEGFRDVDPYKARHWHLESSTSVNPLAKPTGYAIEPDELAFPYGNPDDPSLKKAMFAQHQLWLTRYNPKERYAAGDCTNQAKNIRWAGGVRQGSAVTAQSGPGGLVHHRIYTSIAARRLSGDAHRFDRISYRSPGLLRGKSSPWCCRPGRLPMIAFSHQI